MQLFLTVNAALGGLSVTYKLLCVTCMEKGGMHHGKGAWAPRIDHFFGFRQKNIVTFSGYHQLPLRLTLILFSFLLSLAVFSR